MLTVYCLMVIIATLIGVSKNRPGMGFILGLLLGLIGVIIIACMSKKPVAEKEEIKQFTSSSGTSSSEPIFKDESAIK